MRDPADTVTAEIPGVEPPPAAPPKRTIAERRDLCDWKGPKQRDCCHTCDHSLRSYMEPDTPYERECFRCALGGFPTQRGAICDHFERSEP